MRAPVLELIFVIFHIQIKPGSSHVGFNAELRAADNAAIIEASTGLTSWALFENQTCALAHTNHAEISPTPVNNDQISNNKVQSSSESSSSESDSDEDYEEGDQKDRVKPTEEADDSDDSDDSDDDEDDDDYDGDDNEIEIDDRTKGKRKDALYAEEIDEDLLHKSECHSHNRNFVFLV